MGSPNISRVQLITNERSRLSILEQVRAFCQGGSDWVQLRLKEATEEEARETALKAREITERSNASLILDDRVGLVNEVGADGVHLGERDMFPEKARTVLGKEALIGVTADRFERVRELAWKTDYIGCGPFRNTDTKKALSPVLGVEGFRSILRDMKAEGITIPILAIGGIKKDDVPVLLNEGLFGIALSSAITEAEDPVRETADIIEEVEQAAS
ncbi:MAG: thiamine phosphate synthase [Flavobacteriales bacterium]